MRDVKDFLAQCYAAALRKQEATRIVERDVGMHRYLLMSMHKGLKVTFGRREMRDPHTQLQLLTQLQPVVEDLIRSGKELHNCTICFSAGVSAPLGPYEGQGQERKTCNIYDDVFGRIFLNSLDSAQIWREVLGAVNLDIVYQRQKHIKQIKQMEADVAEKFGFRLFCADWSTLSFQEYQHFLNRMLHEMGGNIAGSAGDSLHKQISVIVSYKSII